MIAIIIAIIGLICVFGYLVYNIYMFIICLNGGILGELYYLWGLTRMSQYPLPEGWKPYEKDPWWDEYASGRLPKIFRCLVGKIFNVILTILLGILMIAICAVVLSTIGWFIFVFGTSSSGQAALGFSIIIIAGVICVKIVDKLTEPDWKGIGEAYRARAKFDYMIETGKDWDDSIPY